MVVTAVVIPRPHGKEGGDAPKDRAAWRATQRRVLWWSVMASAVLWTLVFQASKKDSALPEFVYVNF